jgi:Tol biopolymer transport system component
MTMHRSTRVDRVLPGLFAELADARTPVYLEAAIEHASSGSQRPWWTYPGRWLPTVVAAGVVPRRPLPWRQLGLIVVILIAAALAVYAGSQMQRIPRPFGLAANGVIALARDGDIFVADRPGGDLRPLVAGPELDQAPMFSPDGSKLAFMRSSDGRPDGTGLMVADADGTNVVQLTPRESLDGGWKWSFAPDGQSLIGVARIEAQNRVVVMPVDPHAAVTVLDIRLPGSSMEIEAPIFRPTNAQDVLVVAQLAAGGPRGLYVYDLATGGIRTIVEPTDLYVSDVAWLPDGEHITYSNRVVAADGSQSRVLDTLGADRLSPWSNDGTRIVIDVAETDLPGDDSHQKSVVVPLDGHGEPVELACGPGRATECAWSWIWSPDDSMLIGAISHETSSTYLLADPDTGEVTELDWVDGGDQGALAWQRVAP